MEKRKYPRFELKMSAEYSTLSAEEALSQGRTVNISAEGLCFESNEKITIGSRVKLKVDLKDKMPPIVLFGEIRWFQELKGPDLKNKRYINGIKLIDIHKTDEGRFLKYYCDKMVEKLSGYLKM